MALEVAIPLPPVPESAIFLSSGAAIEVMFDTATNRGGFQDTVACSAIFDPSVVLGEGCEVQTMSRPQSRPKAVS